MFTPAASTRIWLCTQATDMRKSFTGLSALVKNQLGHNPPCPGYYSERLATMPYADLCLITATITGGSAAVSILFAPGWPMDSSEPRYL